MTLSHVWMWRRRKSWLGGIAFGFVAVLFAELPMVITHARISEAVALLGQREGADEQAYERLRTPGQEAFLHRLCYTDGGARGVGDFGPTGHLFDTQMGLAGMALNNWGFWTRSFPADSLRAVFFRVTGQPFSDLPPPSGLGTFGRRGFDMAMDGPDRDERRRDFVWDAERGGDAVGARIRGLSLASSRIDWHLDVPSALTHGEWTLEFRNEHANAQEARCQMLLPPGGCVSRLTLWINGEPREAAFGAKSAVKAAYKQVVTVERRDPVLVNMVGPDRVMTQCFPVPPGGLMKIRLGITAPADQGIVMPLLIERNFSIGEHLKHAVWVQSKDEVEGEGFVKSKDGLWSWQEEVPHARIATLAFRAKTGPAVKVWTEDPLAGSEPKFVLRELLPADSTKRPLVVVIDTSAKLAPHAAKLRAALEKLPPGMLQALFISTDRDMREVKPGDLDEKLFRGGRDAVPALKAALKRARQAGGDATVLWLHGPQPTDMAGKESIEQLLERDATPPSIHAISLVSGRNKLLEDIYDTTALRGGPRWDGSEAGLMAILQNIHSSTTPARRYTRADEVPTEGVKVWEQLARHAVFTEVMAAFQGRDRVPEAQAKRAAQHQLVTPYSGAVVLETQAQYDRAGLKPVDASTTPEIPAGAPEPSRVLLMLLGVAALLMRRRR
ncbi:MAG: PEP-CTERM sorting domain-containing protein [Verrucomicrobiaceae bacterium]|nr:PEP-CTERM sorting domain-containing protein [Verrucomicrobiaceae bacterium]